MAVSVEPVLENLKSRVLPLERFLELFASSLPAPLLREVGHLAEALSYRALADEMRRAA